MKLRRVFLLLCFAIQSAVSAVGQQPRFKVLAFYSDKTELDHIQFAQDAVKFLTERASAEHFTFEATTHWEDLNDNHLRGYQLVIWLNESPPQAEQRSAFERYMQHGGAWLGFHASAYNDRDTNWPWFVDFLGGAVFDINSWPPLTARLLLDDRAHPVTAELPAEFESPSNEWYIWKPSPRLNKDVRVLASFDPSNYPLGFKDVLTSGDLPVVWTNTKYKMLYVNMGHGDQIFTSPIQNRLIDNAINWLVTGAAQPAPAEAIGIRISPHGIAQNPETGKFYAVDTRHGTVTVLDGDGLFLTRIEVGKEPVSIAVNAVTNRIYVANGGSGTVSVIDGATDKIITTVPVGDLPYAMAVNQATNKLYVSRTFSDVTLIIDGRTNTPRTVKAGVGDAVAAESLNNDTFLFSYEAPQVTVFDTTNDHVSTVETTNHLWAMAANTTTNKLYVVSVGSSNLTIIDGTSHAAKVLNAGANPSSVAVDSTLGKVFVTNYASDNISVIDCVNDSVVATVKAGALPQAIAVDSSNHKVFIASTHAGTITVLDGTTLTVTGAIETGKAPFTVAVNSKTHKAVVLGLAGDLTVIDGMTLTTSSPSIH
jgi:YVTN family beta-propeller protein